MRNKGPMSVIDETSEVFPKIEFNAVFP